ncbi:retrovirus-related pol polyprotein from transposon TNT 1-94 [Tanacetum coccineum]
MFDELLTPPPSVDLPAPEVIALIDEEVALVHAVSTGSPSSTTVDQDAPSPSNSQTTPETQLQYFLRLLRQKYDIEDCTYVIWLHEQRFFSFYYDAFSLLVEPRVYKDALTQSCWIKAMQEELNEFEHLEVWELIPRPYKVMVITLKWIYKVKLDELGDGTVILRYIDNRSGSDSKWEELKEADVTKESSQTFSWHGMMPKSIWAAIKDTVFGGTMRTRRKCKKDVLKLQFEAFTISFYGKLRERVMIGSAKFKVQMKLVAGMGMQSKGRISSQCELEKDGPDDH